MTTFLREKPRYKIESKVHSNKYENIFVTVLPSNNLVSFIILFYKYLTFSTVIIY